MLAGLPAAMKRVSRGALPEDDRQAPRDAAAGEAVRRRWLD